MYVLDAEIRGKFLKEKNTRQKLLSTKKIAYLNTNWCISLIYFAPNPLNVTFVGFFYSFLQNTNVQMKIQFPNENTYYLTTFVENKRKKIFHGNFKKLRTLSSTLKSETENK